MKGGWPMYGHPRLFFISALSFCRSNVHSTPLSTLVAVLLSAVPFILFLAVYGANEALRILPTYEASSLVVDIGAWEVSVVGFSVNKMIASLHTTPLDFLSAVPYLGHYVLPVVYPAAVIFIGERPDCARRFYQLVGWTMWVTYVLWYLVPTAPPWFYDVIVDTTTASLGPPVPAAVGARGPSVLLAALQPSPASALSPVTRPARVMREGAAFARVDRAIGFGLFRGLFAGNPVPFAAFPSGHVAWPLCMVLSLPAGWRRWPFVVYAWLVVWATMYSNHHYCSDAVAAATVVFVVEKLTSLVDRVLLTRTKAAAESANSSLTNHVSLP